MPGEEECGNRLVAVAVVGGAAHGFDLRHVSRVDGDTGQPERPEVRLEREDVLDIERIGEDTVEVIDEDRLDRGPEWRSFDDDDARVQRERTGAPLTASRHDRGLSTEIGRHEDGQGKMINGRKRRRLHRLRTHHSRSRLQSKRERNQAPTG